MVQPEAVRLVSADLAAEFLEDCEFRRLAVATRANYRWALNRLVDHCHLLPLTPRELRPVLECPDLATESRRQLVNVLRIFYAWCEEEYAVPNPASRIAKDRPDAPPVRWFRTDEILRLVEVAGGFKHFTGCKDIKPTRDIAMVATLANTGLRIGELASLKGADVHPGRLQVSGKTGAREVPVSPNVEELIRRLASVSEGVMWPSMKGGSLTRRGIQLIVARLIRKAGLTGHRCGPHTLRHSFGTNFVLNGGDVDDLRYILGHKKLEQTYRYVHLAKAERAAEAHARHAPLAHADLDAPGIIPEG